MVSVPISSEDQYIVSSGDDYALRVWSLTTAEVIKVLQGMVVVLVQWLFPLWRNHSSAQRHVGIDFH